MCQGPARRSGCVIRIAALQPHKQHYDKKQKGDGSAADRIRGEYTGTDSGTARRDRP